MAENYVAVTEASPGDKKLHGWDRVISGNTVIDEFTLPGEYPLKSFVARADAVSVATANDHLLCLNAAASTYVRIRYMSFQQQANATAAAVSTIQIMRTTTTAPTGGTASTPAPYDTLDTAAAAARQLPTGKGTESTIIDWFAFTWRQTVATAGVQENARWEWWQKPGQKPIIIPAGATNGLVFKSVSAIAGATANVKIEFVETTFL